jgi:hypothetical protein
MVVNMAIEIDGIDAAMADFGVLDVNKLNY